MKYSCWIGACMIIVIICHMVPGGSSQANQATTRIPPAWDPRNEATYSFRRWSHDVLLWCLTSDLQPYQQCAAIMQRLGGVAKESASSKFTPQEIIHGGMVNGIPQDAVTYLFHGLKERFGALEEETRLNALVGFMQFQRKPNEHINELLTRFEIAMGRAENEAGFVMNIEGLSWMLLRVIGVNQAQFQEIL